MTLHVRPTIERMHDAEMRQLTTVGDTQRQRADDLVLTVSEWNCLRQGESLLQSDRGLFVTSAAAGTIITVVTASGDAAQGTSAAETVGYNNAASSSASLCQPGRFLFVVALFI